VNRLWNDPVEAPLDSREKGVPGGVRGLPLETVVMQGWNLLAEDLPLPAAILKLDALRANSRWMKGFLEHTGSKLAPHGKTTMSPSLFNLQLEDGAWAITVSTAHHLHVARSFGFKRIVLANQLVGRSAIAWVIGELNRDPDFQFYCLVDSIDNLRQLTRVAREEGLQRPLCVLVEIGFANGRTGCRSVAEALDLAREIRSCADVIALSGVEGFEGIIRGPTEAETISKVERFLDTMVELAEACGREELFAPGLVIFSAGGSAFFDLVSAKLGQIALDRDHIVLLRSGCYLTHDSVMYTHLFAQLKARAPDLAAAMGDLQPALEVWAYIQSLPEPGRAIAALGKRDVSYDQPPVPLSWFRPGGGMTRPQPVPPGHKVLGLHDQHCVLEAPSDTPWRVGDMVGFGISHPCLTFDKWRVLHLVGPDYSIVGSVRTYF
jgi:D-serine dehydratase